MTFHTNKPEKETADLSTALRSGRKTSPGRGVNTEISPLRFASVEMTKGKGNGSIESSCWTEAFFITLGGPETHDSSGRDDKFVCETNSFLRADWSQLRLSRLFQSADFSFQANLSSRAAHSWRRVGKQ